MSNWLQHYHTSAVRPAVARAKAGITMLANTERGDWNCHNASMALRIAQLVNDSVPELSIFGTGDIGNPNYPSVEVPGSCNTTHSTWAGHRNPDGEPMCGCAALWFPFARDFLATSPASHSDSRSEYGAATAASAVVTVKAKAHRSSGTVRSIPTRTTTTTERTDASATGSTAIHHTAAASVGSVQYLTFYSNGNGEKAAPGDASKLAAMATMLTTANLSAIENAWTQHHLGGMLTIDSVFRFHINPATGKREGGLREGWQSALRSKLAAAAPLIHRGAIQVIFLGDEICCAQGVPGRNVSSVAEAARHQLDSLHSKQRVLIYLNECSRALHADQRGYLGDPLPAAIDAISLDGYCPSAGNGCSRAAQEATLMRNIYTHQLFPKMLPHQRVFIVPGFFGNGSQPIGPQDAQLVEKWTAYLGWIAAEPRIIGVNP